jgi:hypothetical protein
LIIFLNSELVGYELTHQIGFENLNSKINGEKWPWCFLVHPYMKNAKMFGEGVHDGPP